MIRDRTAKNDGPAASLLEQAQKDDLSSIAQDAAELGLDSLLDDGIVKDIPFVGTVMKLVGVGRGVREALFAKKILKFLFRIKDISTERRRAYEQKSERSSSPFWTSLMISTRRTSSANCSRPA